VSEREKEWAAYQAWKKDFRGPIYFQHWDQWIAEFGFAVWQASRRSALEEAAQMFQALGKDLVAMQIRALAKETNNG
jgi:hypothetical protein